MVGNTDTHLDTLTKRHTDLRTELHRFVRKLDHAAVEDQSVYQEICVLLSHQINQLRKECNDTYEIDTCNQSLDR